MNIIVIGIYLLLQSICIFILIRAFLSLEINDQLKEWAMTERGEIVDVYCSFDVTKFIFLNINLWTFKSTVKYIKKIYKSGGDA